MERKALFLLGVVFCLTSLNAQPGISPYKLSRGDIIEIREVKKLLGYFGDSIWPGFSQTAIPIILYNKEYAFLTGIKSPATGWLKLPSMKQYGKEWEEVSDIENGMTYYRQTIDSNKSPEAFIVRVGNTWVASLTSLEWTKERMKGQIKNRSPQYLKDTAALEKIIQMMGGSLDKHISLIIHEYFHALQATMNPDRLLEAEKSKGIKYPWNDTAHNSALKAEFALLIKAVETNSIDDVNNLAREFVRTRQARYEKFSFDSSLKRFERLQEWEEGLAKYTELTIWKRAATNTTYKPTADLLGLSDFLHYKTFDQSWWQEKMTIKMQPQADDIRFYYSGMLIAMLLDRLSENWKMNALDGRLFPDEILAGLTRN